MIKLLVRLLVAIFVFLITGLLSLLIMKTMFGNPYDINTAEFVGDVFLVIIVICIIFVDSKIKN